MELAASESC